MSPDYAISAADLAALGPEILLTAVGLLILLLDAFIPSKKLLATPIAVVGVLGAASLLPAQLSRGTHFGGLIESSPATAAIGGILLAGALIAILASHGYLKREGIFSGEYHVLMLWCTVGLLLMSRAVELLTIFLTLELLSICLYSLAGFHRRLAVSTEGAIKYFLLGAFVSAFVLLGIALVYGETGTTHLELIADRLTGGGALLWPVALGMVLLVAAFGFKMSLIPFHAWSPDTYQGAPSPFVAFLSVAPKAAAAIVLLRLLELVVPGAGVHWSQLIAVLAALSMIGGNLLAMVQRDIKRMLAYSGIAHMGYLLIPLVTINSESWRAVLIYLAAYTLMNAGAFTVVALLYTRPGEQHVISELAGYGYRYPWLGACLTICMLSLGGIPPTFGFIGKYVVFLHGVRYDHLTLVIIGVLTSLIGVFYYLRVIYNLYMKPEAEETETPQRIGWSGRAAAGLAAITTIVLGIWPSPVMDWLIRSIISP